MQRPHTAHRPAFTLIELLVVISIIGILMSLVMPAIQQIRETARRTECNDRLHNLVLGLHSYESSHKVLPPGSFVRGPSFPTESGWGWGAFVLPFVEQDPVYKQIDFNYHTADPVNRDVIAIPISLYVCPSDRIPERVEIPIYPYPPVLVANGNYCGVEGVLSGMSHTRFRDITDGPSNTLFLGERVFQEGGGEALPFTSAWCGMLNEQDMYVFQSVPHLEAVSTISINQSLKSPGNFNSRHPGGAEFAMGDGKVLFLSENMNGQVFEALGSPAGGEQVHF